MTHDLTQRAEQWRNRFIDLQQGKRTGSLRRQEAIDLELALTDLSAALVQAEQEKALQQQFTTQAETLYLELKARLASQEAALYDAKLQAEGASIHATQILHDAAGRVRAAEDKLRAQEATIRQMVEAMHKEDALDSSRTIRQWADTLATLLPAESKKETENAP